ncbi:hypothetical protein G7Y89_g14058 [Cudoniella acicularis]|uniref:beta-glucosidase n=1 Tax=Cudoniella acicularis TaxID=354080 RepID=A0A8H4VVH0_9HELO|nr:hypothetical protein G7Y89_g14058 [Cudoniella acicularis]
MYSQFKATGLEFYGKGINIVDGSATASLGRTPYNGRLDETLGQDSYFSGITFGIGVKDFTDAGVIARGKHFALYEQETSRMASGDSDTAPYSSVADDKTLHETYLCSPEFRPFYDGVKQGLGDMMCAMNKVNGTLSCENSELLMDLLKTELGFPGLVRPDAGAQSTAFGSFNGGLDYSSSSIWSSNTILAGIANGTLTQARLDDMAVGETADVDVRANHSAIVRTVGAAALVLLKNENNDMSSEGVDRTELRNTEQDTMVTSVASNCNNTIVVVNTVGARISDTWIKNENITAVIYGGLLGQESGNSLVDILYRAVNPSGRLTHTISKNESNYNVNVCETAVCNYTEGNYIDYKYFDKYNVTLRYEFGFGLSFTTFDYSELSVSITNSSAISSTYPTGVLSVGGKTDL